MPPDTIPAWQATGAYVCRVFSKISFVLSLLVAEKNRLSFVHVFAMYIAIQTALFLSAAAERGFVRDVKEKLRYIGADYDTVHKSTAEMDKEKTFELPDENFITIGAERFRCAEVLLLPDFIGTGAADYTTLLSRAT